MLNEKQVAYVNRRESTDCRQLLRDKYSFVQSCQAVRTLQPIWVSLKEVLSSFKKASGLEYSCVLHSFEQVGRTLQPDESSSGRSTGSFHVEREVYYDRVGFKV